MDFKLVSSYKPQGDQAAAIQSLTRGIYDREQHQVLLGVTGSGKTFTMAKVIEAINRPTLVMAHNKTLAAQLYHEFKTFFPHNAVEYFVCYYDYYQPEAYIPAGDVYIEKEATINDELDKLRLSATRSLFERRDCVIVASVSCIYGLGSPEAYYGMLLIARKRPEDQARGHHTQAGRDPLRAQRWRVPPRHIPRARRCHRGLPYLRRYGVPHRDVGRRDRIALADRSAVRHGEADVHATADLSEDALRHDGGDAVRRPCSRSSKELDWWEVELEKQGRLVEAQRLHQRTMFDLEMIKEIGYCHGIENYSRHFTGRLPGEPPPTLLDYFPRDFLMFIDESHQTVPQLRGMYAGDRSRKEVLVEYGFRLPSALDNRPLTFEEFEHRDEPVGVCVGYAGTVRADEIRRRGGGADHPADRV